jgi:hypothetical protein
LIERKEYTEIVKYRQAKRLREASKWNKGIANEKVHWKGNDQRESKGKSDRDTDDGK